MGTAIDGESLLQLVEAGEETFISVLSIGSSSTLQLWEKVAEGLRKKSVLVSLDIVYTPLGADVSKLVAECVEVSRNLKTLHLRANGLGPLGAMYIGTALKDHAAITELSIDSNRLLDPGAAEIAKALEINETLQRLSLAANSIGPKGAKDLAEVLRGNDKQQRFSKNKMAPSTLARQVPSPLRRLDLSDNRIGREGAREIGLALTSNETLTELVLEANELGPEGTGALFEKLGSNTCLRMLNLKANSIVDKGASYIGKALRVNKSLTHLMLGSNRIQADGAKGIADGLKTNVGIQHLEMGPSIIGDGGARGFGSMLLLNQRIRVLDLRGCNIGPNGGAHISRALNSHGQLATLNLHNNIFGPHGGSAMAESLKINKSLRTLNLGRNHLSDACTTAFSKALLVNDTLEELVLSENNIGNQGAANLAKGLTVNSSLEVIGIGSAGAVELSKAIQTNRKLVFMSLFGNEIEDDGARALLSALKQNESMVGLSMGENKVTEDLLLDIADELEERPANENPFVYTRLHDARQRQRDFERMGRAQTKVNIPPPRRPSKPTFRRPVPSRTGRNAVSRTKHEPEFETEVGKLLAANGLREFARAFYDNRVESLEQASRLTSVEFKLLGVKKLNDLKAMNGLFSPQNKMTPLGKLLSQSRYAQYCQLFYENEVYSLTPLSHEDLEFMGVTNPEHREGIYQLLRKHGRGAIAQALPSFKAPASTMKYDCFLTHNWGEDELGRMNHDTVSLVNSALKKKGLNTWFDEERMEGFVVDQMTTGIDKSHVIVAFITKTYMNKVGSSRHNDNCKLEFNYALNRKSGAMIAVPMESRTLDPTKWTGPVGAVLGGKLYEANFAFDVAKDIAAFDDQVEKLYRQILRLKDLEQA